MIVNKAFGGEIHSRFNMDTMQIEMSIHVTPFHVATVTMRPGMALGLIATLQRLVAAHDEEEKLQAETPR